ncbi:MAG: 50S ribosomal protein L9 [Planctomycetaceae bacterium]|nr:50S ribosomal protein L9 [Planctomycetaceae bacterium]
MAAVASSRNLELLLAEDVQNLGKQGEIVSVKPGFARNYLLPQGLATVATAHNKKMVEQHRIRLQELEAERLKAIKELANNVSKYSVTLEANANQDGHLYGSITAPEISKALKAANYDVEAEHIKLEGPLKELGMYTVKLEFHEKVQSEVKVWVVPAVNK